MDWRSKLLLFSILCSLYVAVSTEAVKKITFQKEKIKIGKKELIVEIADTEEKISRGLMFRKKRLKNSEGMLFVFKDSRKRTFWMKNTFIPLSIGFFDKDRYLIHVEEMVPVKSEMETPETYNSRKSAQYALEVAPGWFKKNGVKLGSRLSKR